MKYKTQICKHRECHKIDGKWKQSSFLVVDFLPYRVNGFCTRKCETRYLENRGKPI
jgi:hypothetical protein